MFLFGPLRDGRIKLFGRDNTQALLESPEAEPSKFLQVHVAFLFLPCISFNILEF
jgi:hypothetical protein